MIAAAIHATGGRRVDESSVRLDENLRPLDENLPGISSSSQHTDNTNLFVLESAWMGICAGDALNAKKGAGDGRYHSVASSAPSIA
jgi:hypothetical protein